MIGTPLEGTNYQYRHLALDHCDSTNTQCMNFANEGEASNLWVTAKSQTAAKGSRGRGWTCLEGNLFASLLMRDIAPVEKLYQLTFVTAISVSAAISQFSGNHLVAHKWPNDLLLNTKKCCGILLESRMHGDKSTIVIGVGVNCASFPDNTLHQATSLAHEGISCEAAELFDAIAIHMANNIMTWDKGNNFDAIRNSWLEKAYGINEEVYIKLPGKPDLRGVFSAIDESGLLLLKLQDGQIQKISTADIFFNQAE